MARKSWKKMLERAVAALYLSHSTLNEAVKILMREKGFTEEQVELFGADFASGEETIIKFNDECEMADLDVLVAAAMSKEEIIERLLTNEVSDTTRELLKC